MNLAKSREESHETLMSYYNYVFICKYNKYCQTFLDNIVIYNNIEKKYLKYLKTIFALFKEKEILVSSKKLFISYLSIKFLDFKVNTFKLSNTESYIKAF